MLGASRWPVNDTKVGRNSVLEFDALWIHFRFLVATLNVKHSGKLIQSYFSQILCISLAVFIFPKYSQVKPKITPVSALYLIWIYFVVTELSWNHYSVAYKKKQFKTKFRYCRHLSVISPSQRLMQAFIYSGISFTVVRILLMS